MNYYGLFRRHETSKAREIGINLCVQSDRKEKRRPLVFVEVQDSLRFSKSTQKIVTTTTALQIGPWMQ